LSVTRVFSFSWLRGYQHNCSVNNATLNRFFALHFVLPFVLAALAVMHLIALHDRSGWLSIGPKFSYMKFTSLCKTAALAFIIPNTRANKRIGPHNEDIISVLVGSLLGDANAERSMNGGVRFKFRQSIKHKDYLFWLYKFFTGRGYSSNNLPLCYTQKYGDKLYIAYSFNTYYYTSFMWLYKLFYNNKKKKVIPKNISDYLTPLALAVWIMDDGTYLFGRVDLNGAWGTSYSVQDLNKLINALRTRYGLNCYFYHKKGRSSVVISKDSLELLRTIVRPYMHASMLHKIGIFPSDYN